MKTILLSDDIAHKKFWEFGQVYNLKQGIAGIKSWDLDGHSFKKKDTLACAKALFARHLDTDYVVFCCLQGYPTPDSLLKGFLRHLAETGTPYANLDGGPLSIPEISIEAISRRGVELLASQKRIYLPNGLMNGYSLEGAEPYSWTPEQMGFYLRDRFHEYYSKPKSISVEVTPSCNLHCIKCHCQSPLRQDKTPYQGPSRMSFENWKLIIDKLAAEYPGISVSPTIRGEALIHPDIVNMTAYAVKKGHPVYFFTNGNLLTPEIAKGLVDAGLTALTISLDANSHAEYNRLQPGGDYDRVVENIETFLKLRKGKSPGIGMHFVESPDNTNLFNSYLQRWLNTVDSVSKSVWLDFSKGHRPWKKYLTPKHRLPCAWLWTNMYIHANGSAALCGLDIREEWGLGDIYKDDIAAIWNGEGYRRAREAQFNLKDAVKFCKGDISWSGNLSYQKIEGDSLITTGPMYLCYAPLPSRAVKIGKKVEKILNDSGVVSPALREQLAGFYRRLVLK